METQDHWIKFEGDDQPYLRWVAEHPRGFVLNCHREPRPDYLMLHKATCTYISSKSWKNYTTNDFIKICANDPSGLAAWAMQMTGGALSPCKICKPQPPSIFADRPKRVSDRKPVPSPHDGATSTPIPYNESLPARIDTGCPELDRAWSEFAPSILDRLQVLIPDTDEDLNWHAFLGHSIDMQGFRAAEFAGVDALTRNAPRFIPLNKRGLGVAELAALWEIAEIRNQLLARGEESTYADDLASLRAHGGATGHSLAEAFDHFPWRKFRWSIRALLQNSAALRAFNFSFRRWIRHECERLGVTSFPPNNFRKPVILGGEKVSLERALRTRLERAFYMVGPAMSAYMLCDWQLWLWRQGQTAVFANFKLDSFHEAFIKKFAANLIPADEPGFARWWLGRYPELPPRLINECIWLAVEHKQVNPWP